MTALSGAEVGASTHLSRRLSLLPAVLGTVAVIVLVSGSIAAGVPDGTSWGGTVTSVAAACLVVTVISGHPVGVYAGLALLVVAGLGSDDQQPLDAVPLAVLGVTIVVTHEIIRPSLDARRPARFGPGLWRRWAIRTTALAGAVTATASTAAAGRELDLEPWLVPAGLALAATPLFVRRVVTGETTADEPNGRLARLGPAVVRVGLGAALAAIAVGAAIVGAIARSGIVSTSPAPPPEPTETTPTTAPTLEATVVERGIGLLLFVIALVIAGFLYVALRRPEVGFELDELDMDLDDVSLGLAGPGQADLDDDSIEIDEQELVRLLDGLALDIGGERDPGRAIRFGYANIERRLGESDVARGDSETEQEFLLRALPALGPSGDAMVELTGLFERARFDQQPVTEQMRHRALAAVGALREAIARPEPGEGGRP